MKPLLTPITLLSLASLGLAQTSVTLDGASGSQTYNVVRTTDGGLSLGLEFSVQYLLVGGGGAGGATATITDGVDGSGGGGAGGFLEGTVALTNQSYNLSVGAGGAGTVRGVVNGENGGNTTFAGLTASGGGGGGGYALTGNTGGSGGGGGGRQNVAGGLGTTGQGFSGGRAQSENVTGQAAGGGGGGTGGAGPVAEGQANRAGQRCLRGDARTAGSECARVLAAYPDFPTRLRETIATQWHLAHLERIFRAFESVGVSTGCV